MQEAKAMTEEQMRRDHRRVAHNEAKEWAEATNSAFLGSVLFAHRLPVIFNSKERPVILAAAEYELEKRHRCPFCGAPAGTPCYPEYGCNPWERQPM